MANIIATENILKGTMYQRIKDLLISVGWTNISSNAADFDVFYSTGEDEDKTLYFQMKPANIVTTGLMFQVRLINRYTPGASGAVGIIDPNRTGELWRNIYITTTGPLTSDTSIEFSYQVNKDRIIFCVGLPLAQIAANYYGNICYIGAPQLFEAEPNSRSVSLFLASYDATINNVALTMLTTQPPYTDIGVTEILTVYKTSPISEYNNEDKRFMSEITYGNSTYGLRGKIDGVYYLNNGFVRTSHGDILTDGISNYKVVKMMPTCNVLYGATDSYMYAFKVS